MKTSIDIGVTGNEPNVCLQPTTESERKRCEWILENCPHSVHGFGRHPMTNEILHLSVKLMLRQNPISERQKAFGKAWRRNRRESGKNLVEIGEAIGEGSIVKCSQIERGEHFPTEHQVISFCDCCDADKEKMLELYHNGIG